MKARAAGAAAGGLLAGLLLAGCGIPTTGVVEAGEPAVGAFPEVTLYFVRVQDGTLATVQRRANGKVDPASAVGMLLNGLGQGEGEAMGLTTNLPSPADVTTVRTDGATMTVGLKTPGGKLRPVAVAQVVCTALANRGAGAVPSQVTVTVNGLPMPPPTGLDSCAARLWADRPPGAALPSTAGPGAAGPGAAGPTSARPGGQVRGG